MNFCFCKFKTKLLYIYNYVPRLKRSFCDEVIVIKINVFEQIIIL